jgi:hypothetical protein
MFAPIAAERELKIYLISEHYTRHVQPRRGLTARLGRPAQPASRSSRSRPGAAARWRRFKAKGLAIA